MSCCTGDLCNDPTSAGIRHLQMAIKCHSQIKLSVTILTITPLSLARAHALYMAKLHMHQSPSSERTALRHEHDLHAVSLSCGPAPTRICTAAWSRNLRAIPLPLLFEVTLFSSMQCSSNDTTEVPADLSPGPISFPSGVPGPGRSMRDGDVGCGPGLLLRDF